MSSEHLIYVVCLLVSSKKYFLLWRDCGPDPDRYVSLPDSTRLLVARTSKEVLALAVKSGMHVEKHAPVLVDLDAGWRALAGLRSGRRSSQAVCRVLLNAWNALEDMARTMEIAIHEENPRSAKLLQKTYDKLFYGNNIPAVTPAVETYLPVFSDQERQLMRTSLRHLWLEVQARCPEFQDSQRPAGNRYSRRSAE